ncbi:MAG: hypothetical protein RL065_386 [Bacteroidota bacterium]
MKYLNVYKIAFIIILTTIGFANGSYACLPNITIANSALNICTTNASCNFTSLNTFGGTSPSYLWYKNGVSTGLTTQNISLTGLQDNDSIWCQLTSNEPCATPINMVNSNHIIINFPPLVPTVTISHTPSEICQNTLVTFTATAKHGGTTPTFTWKKGGVTVGNFASYTTNSLQTGDSVWCVITSNDPCVVTNNAQSNIEYINLINISAQAGLDKSICLNNFCFIGSPTLPIVKYKWVPSAGLSYDNISNPMANPTSTTTYNLTVTTPSGSCTRTDNVVITVNPLPVVSIGNDTTICFGKSLLLDAGAGFVSYWWNTSITNQYYTVIAPFIYAVTVTDNNGCQSTDSITVNFVDCNTGLDILSSDNKLKVFPNPAINSIQISSEIAFNSLEIYDIFWVKKSTYFASNANESEHEFSLENLSSGVYFVKVISGDNATLVRFMKQ